MDMLGLTVGDISIIITIGVAAFLGMALGFVKAVLFVGSWISAAAIAYFLYQDATPYFSEYFETRRIAEISAATTVFVITLIFLFFVFSRIWKRVKESEFNSLDRTLGLVSGLTVGILLVCAAYLAAHWELGDDNLPPYIAEARLRPFVQFCADAVRPFLPPEMQEKTKSVIRATRSRAEDAEKVENALNKLNRFQSLTTNRPSTLPNQQKGYAAPSRRDMDRLIESNQ
ncbi:MAG: hypothetical protein CMP14_08555 [Rickettsiales bacterium]|nr:hypothetical protein [Rickettsiales bacterium]|tara:strand:+ start:1118 stop:1804 length:687 start_codon:yes stop_codon:yes gene_type:complete